MMFPEGTMWLDGSLYVAAPPSIWKLTDTDGDGVADQRDEWFQGKTLTGCANDLHGPYLGPDGWIYWCKGAFAEQTYERPGKPPLVTRAAHIFRCRPDGTGIEPVMTGGMDNPVDVVFTPGGERIFTTTFFQHPGGGQRDGLIHAIYGGVYGKVHDAIFDRPQADRPRRHARAAPPRPGRPLRPDALRVGRLRHGLSRQPVRLLLQPAQGHPPRPDARAGRPSRPTTRISSTSPDLDFHPTDVLEDADGSLLVVDTGGWYKLCCPTSQLQKPDVLGAIYRVRRSRVARRVDDPAGRTLRAARTSLNSASMAEDSSSFSTTRGRPCSGGPSRFSLRLQAKKLVALGAAARLLSKITSLELQAQRRLDLDADRRPRPPRAWFARFLADPDETVRQAAIHSAGSGATARPSRD